MTAVDAITGGRFGFVTVKAPASNAVCVLVTMLMVRGPSDVVEETEIVAMRDVGDTTCVELTVIPAPKVGVVRPATNWTLADPSIRTATCCAPRTALLACGSVIWMISSVRPPALSLVVRLRTRMFAVPTASPEGTVIPIRRRPFAASRTAIVSATRLTAAPP